MKKCANCAYSMNDERNRKAAHSQCGLVTLVLNTTQMIIERKEKKATASRVFIESNSFLRNIQYEFYECWMLYWGPTSVKFRASTAMFIIIINNNNNAMKKEKKEEEKKNQKSQEIFRACEIGIKKQ